MPRELSPEEKERIVAEMTSALERVAGERVLAFGFFGQAGLLEETRTELELMPDGSLQRVGGPSLSRIFKRLFGSKGGAGMPFQVYLAVTPTRVLAVSYRMGPGGMSPKEILRAWDRSTTRVEVQDRPPGADVSTGAKVALFEEGQESPFVLESLDMGHDVNDAVLVLLRG